jgi:hypothetical protein
LPALLCEVNTGVTGWPNGIGYCNSRPENRSNRESWTGPKAGQKPFGFVFFFLGSKKPRQKLRVARRNMADREGHAKYAEIVTDGP